MELVLPLMTSDLQSKEPQAYEEVMISIKMLTLKSYDESLSINEYLNTHCVVLETPEFKFLNNIKDTQNFEDNFQACLKAKSISSEVKFYLYHIYLQVKDPQASVQPIVTKQVRSNALK